MATFNREDLITFAELAPSLQAIFEGLQTQISRQQNQYTQLQDDITNIATNPIFQEMVQNEVERQVRIKVAEIMADVIANYEFEAKDDIEQLRRDLQDHTTMARPHPNTGTEFLTRRPNQRYYVGDLVFAPELPAYYMLECVTPGVTANERTEFANNLRNLDV